MTADRFGYSITGEVAHLLRPGGASVCGTRVDYERGRDERPLCTWCERGITRGRAQALRRAS